MREYLFKPAPSQDPAQFAKSQLAKVEQEFDRPPCRAGWLCIYALCCLPCCCVQASCLFYTHAKFESQEQALIESLKESLTAIQADARASAQEKSRQVCSAIEEVLKNDHVTALREPLQKIKTDVFLAWKNYQPTAAVMAPVAVQLQYGH